MDILIVLAHPDEKSFNHAIANQVIVTLKKNGHTVTLHDLYKEGFDPILPGQEIPRNIKLPKQIEQHCKKACEADGIIVVHPNWWGMPPAILTGWVDRIMRPGMTYEFVEGDNGEGVPVGLLNADKALVFNTSNTFEEREKAVFGDPLDRIWKDCIFDLCGVKETYRKTFGVVVTSTLEERQTWLMEIKEKVDEFFPVDS